MKPSDIIKIINRFSTLHRNRIQKIMEEEGLYFGQHPILWELLKNGSQTQVELARRLGVTTVTVNNSVRRLSKGGFIVKEEDPNDLRKTHIRLTEKGKESAVRCQNSFCELDQELFRGISETEMEVLYQMFGRMIQNLS